MRHVHTQQSEGSSHTNRHNERNAQTHTHTHTPLSYKDLCWSLQLLLLSSLFMVSRNHIKLRSQTIMFEKHERIIMASFTLVK